MLVSLGLMASLGLKEVPVYRRLRVAYFSTGDEILSLGEPPREGGDPPWPCGLEAWGLRPEA